MKKMFQSLTQMYATPTPDAMRAKALREAQADLMNAEASAEYYIAHTAMLRKRVQRLRRGVAR